VGPAAHRSDALAVTHTDSPGDAASASIVARCSRSTRRVGGAEDAGPVAVAPIASDDSDGGLDLDGFERPRPVGRKTVSGATMLLGNPHLRWQQLYWEAHVKVPGRLDFYGSTLVGYPWLRAGFNDRLGYVQTNNNSDNRDVFALPSIRSGRTLPVRGEAAAAPARGGRRRGEGDEGSMTTERRTYWRSHLGPSSIATRPPRSPIDQPWRRPGTGSKASGS